MRSAVLFEKDALRRKDGGRGPQRDPNQGPRPPARSRRNEEDGDSGKARPGWFQHDDRDRQDSGDGRQNDRRSGRGPRSERKDDESLDQSRGSQSEEWEYLDPSNKIQGPFPAEKLLSWAELGYFPASLRVRTVGSSRFVSLESVQGRLKQLVAPNGPRGPPGGQGGRQPYGGGGGFQEDRRGDRARDRQLYTPGPPRDGRGGGDPAGRGGAAGGRMRGQNPSRGYDSPPGGRSGGPRGAESSPKGRGGERGGRRQPMGPRDAPKVHPADKLLSNAERETRGPREPDLGPPRDRDFGGQRDRDYRGPRDRDMRPPREQDDRGGRGRGRGDAQPGRAAQASNARGRGDRGKPGSNLPYPLEMAKKLFQAEAELASNHPVWWYIDPTQTVQGPFPANNMITWFQEGYLHDMNLPICGTERKVAPPNTPVLAQYVPLRQLFEAIKTGQRFRPVTIQEIARFREGGTPSESGSSKQSRAGGGKQQAKAQQASARGIKQPSPRGKSWASETAVPETAVSAGAQGPAVGTEGNAAEDPVRAMMTTIIGNVTGSARKAPQEAAVEVVPAKAVLDGDKSATAEEEPSEQGATEAGGEAKVPAKEGGSAGPGAPAGKTLGDSPPEGDKPGQEKLASEEDLQDAPAVAEEEENDTLASGKSGAAGSGEKEVGSETEGASKPLEASERKQGSKPAEEPKLATPAAAEAKPRSSGLAGFIGGLFGRSKPVEKPVEEPLEKPVEKLREEPLEKPTEPVPKTEDAGEDSDDRLPHGGVAGTEESQDAAPAEQEEEEQEEEEGEFTETEASVSKAGPAEPDETLGREDPEGEEAEGGGTPALAASEEPDEPEEDAEVEEEQQEEGSVDSGDPAEFQDPADTEIEAGGVDEEQAMPEVPPKQAHGSAGEGLKESEDETDIEEADGANESAEEMSPVALSGAEGSVVAPSAAGPAGAEVGEAAVQDSAEDAVPAVQASGKEAVTVTAGGGDVAGGNAETARDPLEGSVPAADAEVGGGSGLGSADQPELLEAGNSLKEETIPATEPDAKSAVSAETAVTGQDAGGQREPASPTRAGLVKAAVALFEKKEEAGGSLGLPSRGSGSLPPVPRSAPPADAAPPPAAPSEPAATGVGAAGRALGEDGKAASGTREREGADVDASEKSGAAAKEPIDPAISSLVSRAIERVLSSAGMGKEEEE
eukprot:jgi/Botrbrau1/18037/Bobra.0062s0027.1